MELTFRNVFAVLVCLTALQRLAELFISKRNEKRLKNMGGFVVPEWNYLFMVLMHTSWIGVVLYQAFQIPFLTFYPLAFVGFCIGQTLRLVAMLTLGGRWTTRIVILPKAPAVGEGVFQWIRHPNYLGVVFEIACLPLVAGLWRTALAFSILNALILFFRIRLEEQNLEEYNNYGQVFGTN